MAHFILQNLSRPDPQRLAFNLEIFLPYIQRELTANVLIGLSAVELAELQKITSKKVYKVKIINYTQVHLTCGYTTVDVTDNEILSKAFLENSRYLLFPKKEKKISNCKYSYQEAPQATMYFPGFSGVAYGETTYVHCTPKNATFHTILYSIHGNVVGSIQGIKPGGEPYIEQLADELQSLQVGTSLDSMMSDMQF